jgi:hypothetical protein
MAMTARFFSDSQIAARDLYRFVKIIERKIIRMPKAVRRLCRILAKKIVRRVTVVAGCDRFVAGFLPAGILLVHNVAIRARDRVITHVRIAFCINEREQTDTNRGSDRDSDEDKFEYL